MIIYKVRLIKGKKNKFLEMDVIIDVDEDIYILDVVDEVGIDLFVFCCVGVCFSCIGRLVEGEID